MHAIEHFKPVEYDNLNNITEHNNKVITNSHDSKTAWIKQLGICDSDKDTPLNNNVKQVTHIEFKEPEFVLKPRTAFVENGNSAIFLCRASGEPPPTVNWSRNGETVYSQGKYKISSGDDNILEIRSVKSTDEGIYTCTLTNTRGSVSTETNLVIKAQGSIQMQSPNPTNFRSVLRKSSPNLDKEEAVKISKDVLISVERNSSTHQSENITAKQPLIHKIDNSEPPQNIGQTNEIIIQSEVPQKMDITISRETIKKPPTVHVMSNGKLDKNPLINISNEKSFRTEEISKDKFKSNIFLLHHKEKHPKSESSLPRDRFRAKSPLCNTSEVNVVKNVADYRSVLKHKQSKGDKSDSDSSSDWGSKRGNIADASPARLSPLQKQWNGFPKSNENQFKKDKSNIHQIDFRDVLNKKKTPGKSHHHVNKLELSDRLNYKPIKIDSNTKLSKTERKTEEIKEQSKLEIKDRKEINLENVSLKKPPEVAPKPKYGSKIEKMLDDLEASTEEILAMPGGSLEPHKKEGYVSHNAVPVLITKDSKNRIRMKKSPVVSSTESKTPEVLEKSSSTSEKEKYLNGTSFVRATPVTIRGTSKAGSRSHKNKINGTSPEDPISEPSVTVKNELTLNEQDLNQNITKLADLNGKDYSETADSSFSLDESNTEECSESESLKEEDITDFHVDSNKLGNEDEKTVSIIQAVLSNQEEKTVLSQTDQDFKVIVGSVQRERRLSRSTSIDKVHQQLPIFHSQLSGKVVNEGGCATFECKVIGSPKPEISWFMNNNKIKPSKFFRMSYDEDDIARLVIAGAYPEDQGEYTCIAANCVGMERQSCDLQVLESSTTSAEQTDEEILSELSTSQEPVPPKIIEISPSNLTVLKGGTADIVVSFVSDPFPQINWSKDSVNIETGGRLSVSSKESASCLTICDVNMQDSGIYNVNLENNNGKDSGTFTITVENVPDPPVGKPYASEVSLQSIIMSWSGPPYDGGRQVISYKVEICAAETEQWQTLCEKCYSTSYHASNLRAYTPYFFRVSAQNKHGISNPSEISEVIVTKDRRPSVRLSIESDDEELPFSPRVVTASKDRVFEDVYDVQKEIGKGKFGSVFKCVEKENEKTWAAKIIKCRGKDRENVRQEISVMNELIHPKLLMLRDAFETARNIILVMEYVGGGELFERVVDEDFDLTERDCVHFMSQICEGVQYMHKKHILHLDLKPENILCVHNDSNRIKIIDFGLARFHKPGESLRVMFGTPEFIAPEVVNFEEIGLETDIWSLGVICYVLLSGLSPFMGDSDAETLANVTRGEFDFDDEAFDEISKNATDFIEKTLKKNKKKRMTVEECLNHKWLAKADRNNSKKLRQSLRNLKQFMARRKWQKMGTAIRAIGRMSTMQRNLQLKGGRFVSESSVSSESGNASSQSDSPMETRSRSSSSRMEDVEIRAQEQESSDKTTDINNTHQDSVFIKDHPQPNIEKQDANIRLSSCNSCETHANSNNVKNTDSEKYNLCETESVIVSENSDTSKNLSPVFDKTMVDSEAFTGDVVRFDVIVKGTPDTKVKWYVDDQEIVEDHRYLCLYGDKGDYSLIIKNVQDADDGEYICRAWNQFGESTCSAELIVCGTGAF